jgi:DNA polymerase V
MYALVDCNNFYVSCERVFDPSLRGEPVIVLSNNDGCIISRSDEAKALDIEMAAPVFEYRDLIKQHDISVFSSNYALYGDMSQRVINTLTEFTDHVEKYSIDEAFLRFDDPPDKLIDLGMHLHRTVRQWTGIPVGVGFGPTKTLAKIANEMAKDREDQNVAALTGTDEITAKLRETDVDDVWGIGPRYAAMLNAHEVHTADEFRRLPDRWIRDKMTVVGLRTAMELRRHPCIELEEEPEPRKGIMSSRTFPDAVSSPRALEQAISRFTARAARKLRGQNSVCSSITVFIATNRFDDEQPHHTPSRTTELPAATAHTPILLNAARGLLHDMFRSDRAYKKAGVRLEQITPESRGQKHLYLDDSHEEEHQALMDAVDDINDRYGRETITFGSEGRRDQQSWRMKQEHLSPRYTTRWSDLPIAHA